MSYTLAFNSPAPSDGQPGGFFHSGRMKVSGTIAAIVALFVAALLLVSSPRIVSAGNCYTFLAIGDAVARSAPDGAVLDLTGVWEFDNLMQVQLGLSLNVVVIQGDKFVRFPLLGVAQAGVVPGLNDGLELGEIPAVEAAGVDDPDAEVLTFRAHRLQLSLPPSIQPGAVSVVMYLVQDAQYQSAFLSNTLSTVL